MAGAHCMASKAAGQGKWQKHIQSSLLHMHPLCPLHAVDFQTSEYHRHSAETCLQDKNGIWNQFGGRMAWDAKAIVLNDRKFKGRGNRASGASFDAAPNIDHSQAFVKQDLSEWLQWLRTEIGFDGWRCVSWSPYAERQTAFDIVHIHF